MSMTIDEAIKRIRNHMEVHRIGQYPHIHIGEALTMAIDALQEKAEREDPKPLTIEELRQMDGEPVWVVEWNHWALVSVEEIRKLGEIPFLRCVMYGVEHCYNADVQNIHCYRHKPKEET